MRILLATQWYPPDTGGVARHVEDLAHFLKKRDHEVMVVTRKRDGREKNESRIYELNGIEYLQLLATGGNGVIKKILKEFEPNIVHVHHAFTPIPVAVSLSSKINNYPTILTNHSAYFYDYKYILKTISYIGLPFKTILSKIDSIIAVSNIAKKFIESFVSDKEIYVIPNGVDIDRFNPNGSRNFREKFDDIFIILFVGRLVRRKGVHLLIEAMKYVANEVNNVKLIVAGDGPLKNFLKNRILDLNLSEHVELLGKVDDRLLPDLYRSSNLFILPSIYGESFGIVVLEAMACGTPVLVSRIGGLREIVVEGVNGSFLYDRNPKSIAGKIVDIYLNYDIYLDIAKQAWNIVERKYSWNNIVKKIEKIYLKFKIG